MPFHKNPSLTWLTWPREFIHAIPDLCGQVTPSSYVIERSPTSHLATLCLSTTKSFLLILVVAGVESRGVQLGNPPANHTRSRRAKTIRDTSACSQTGTHQTESRSQKNTNSQSCYLFPFTSSKFSPKFKTRFASCTALASDR